MTKLKSIFALLLILILLLNFIIEFYLLQLHCLILIVKINALLFNGRTFYLLNIIYILNILFQVT